ncbi:MAG: serine/threonine protein kinase, partial [Cyanobacteria bacterium J083]
MSNLPALSDRGYEIIKQLGCNREGGRITWQAKHKATEQKVIIKQFRFATADSSWSGYKAYQQEIEILKKLDHPHIPKYIDSFETSDGFCLVQAYQPGRSLAEIEN